MISKYLITLDISIVNTNCLLSIMDTKFFVLNEITCMIKEHGVSFAMRLQNKKDLCFLVDSLRLYLDKLIFF